MEQQRTVKTKLDVDDHAAALLEDTIDQFLLAAQYVTDHGFKGQRVTTSKQDLHDQTYESVRRITGHLNSNLIQTARNKAATACKSTVARWKQGNKASKPSFSSPHVAYNKRSATFHDDYVSLATVDGRVELDYILPRNLEDTPHEQYLFNPAYDVTSAELHHRPSSDEWYLHIHCEQDNEDVKPATENGTVLGVDLGINQLAVTSTSRFWSGDELDHWRTEYEDRRGDLQECGTRWAHENMQAMGRKEDGRLTMLLHRISNELVEEARDNECSVIAFEDLTGIRDSTDASWGHRWAFNKLYEYVKYKAEEYGIAVEQVDPADTSQQCSHCGFTDEDNRSGEDFECGDCGYENHADYNAAKNIGLRFLRQHQTGAGGGALLGVRLNSGVMNAKGGLEPSTPIVG